MKRLLLTLVAVAFGSVASGQGTIQFNNGPLTRLNTNSIWGGITGGRGPVSTSAPNFMYYGVFVGMDSNELSLTAAPLGVNSTTSAGVIELPGGTVPQNYQIPEYPPQTDIYLQIRAWDQALGPTGWQGTWAFPGHCYGQSSVALVRLGPSIGPGTVIWQMAGSPSSADRIKPFDIYITPAEPSTTVLIGLGLAGLIFLRRRGSVV